LQFYSALQTIIDSKQDGGAGLDANSTEGNWTATESTSPILSYGGYTLGSHQIELAFAALKEMIPVVLTCGSYLAKIYTQKQVRVRASVMLRAAFSHWHHGCVWSIEGGAFFRISSLISSLFFTYPLFPTPSCLVQ